MSNCKKILFFIICLIPGLTQAQSLRGLQENPVIKNYRADENPTLKSASNQLRLYLPFFEDFSTSSILPDPDKWTDQYVYINNSFGLNPPSVTVATFDAIDQNGNVYAIRGTTVSSDTLTSVEFDLSVYQGTMDTVRLSFFYQCGGHGEVPEFGDLLVLEYYHPQDSVWNEAWSVEGGDTTAFTQVILKVPEEYYLNGFRFRFRNYTSLSAEDVNGGEGALSNADCWNIDYILMNTDPEYNHKTINNDITITDIPRNVLDLYETVPWHHLNSAVTAGIARNSIIYGIRNYMPEGDSSNIGRSYYVRNYNEKTFDNYEPPWDEQLPNGVLVFRDLPLLSRFSENDNLNEGRIEIASYLRTLDFGTKANDTSRVVLYFKNNYVYDDGSPEYGFGIEGPSMTGALLAMRFRVYEPDTLTAAEIYFNRAYNKVNETFPFQLCVWKDGGGKPGDLIYISEESNYPDFSSEKPDFKSYALLASEGIVVTDSIIYIGIKQQTDEFLNIGYDANNNNLSRTFVNTSGEWFSPGGSLLPGTVMMRAVFGNRGIITDRDDIAEGQDDIVLYPNPVSEILYVNSEKSVQSFRIVDISGRIVLQQTGIIRNIDISDLPPGIYQVILFTGSERPVIRKILVSR
ncbi:MAG TPA: T9SS type A sorting domain-containing protein [Bacteroidales bacterium]|nr:T9SS type A sorting domain-containing protein [Bacteroidales bacterium]